jgi:RimJ/RimL family protein N-acetyltransferase
MRDEEEDYRRWLDWRRSAHVAEWWWNDEDREPTLSGVIEEYRADVRGQTETTACFIELKGQPIGFIQFYPWQAYPEELVEMGFELPPGFWGVDIFIGEADQLGRGYGSQAIGLLSRNLRQDRGATGIALVVARDNHRAQRAYEKAGMRRVRDVLDIDRRNGERIPSYLMSTDPLPRPPRKGEGEII